MAERIQTGLRIPSKLHRKLSRYALDNNQTLNSIVCEAIELWWKKVPYHLRAFYSKRPPSSRPPRRNPTGDS
jgi:hypothetical protein